MNLAVRVALILWSAVFLIGSMCSVHNVVDATGLVIFWAIGALFILFAKERKVKK